MRVSLGEVCNARSSLVDPTRVEYQDLAHVAPDSIERDTGRILEIRSVAEDGVTSGKYRFEPGDILYSKIRPNLNKVAEIDFGGLCSADMYALDVDPSRAFARFITYMLRGQAFLEYATSLSNRANIPKPNRDQLMRFEFELPPLDRQRRIASTLDQADALRAKRRQVLAHLGGLNHSVFDDMFGTTDARGARLVDVADVTSGITKGRRTSEPTSLVPYLAVANVQAEHLKLGAVKEIKATTSEIERYALRDGDLVLTEGGDPDKLGRGTLWRNEIPLCIHQNHIFRVRIKRDAQIMPDYLAAYIAGRSARRYFLRSAKQTTGIASINTTQLKALPVSVPPMELQRAYLERLQVVARQRAAVWRSLAAEDELFATVQSRAFSGTL